MTTTINGGRVQLGRSVNHYFMYRASLLLRVERKVPRVTS